MMSVRVVKLSEIDDAALERLLRRHEPVTASVLEACRNIIDDVRRRGDEAVLAHTAEFDDAILSVDRLRVTEEEFETAERRVSPDMQTALQCAMDNVRHFHQSQVPLGMRWMETARGVWCGERWTPIDSVCLYVPRGRGSFPSVACMLGVPAQLAGVPRIVMCTPPGASGDVDAATLFVAKTLGLHEVYRIGGAQAVAAVAYGTSSVPRCEKFIGPGNVYVSGARRILAEVIDPGPPAGPSESLIVCDESADPENAAWNLLIEAEHGENSTAVLVTHVPALARRIAEEVPRCSAQLVPQRREYVEDVLGTRGGILITKDLQDSILFANRFAAEHVALMVRDPWSVLGELTNAGEILFGDYPIISLANYAMGVNAVLPTGGRARTAAGVSVCDFLKRTALGFVTSEGFAQLRRTVPAMSRYEGFSAHHEAIERWRANTGR